MLERASRPSKAVPHLFCPLWNLSSNRSFSGRLTPAAAGFLAGRRRSATKRQEPSGPLRIAYKRSCVSTVIIRFPGRRSRALPNPNGDLHGPLEP
jgi:hypothetical protein